MSYVPSTLKRYDDAPNMAASVDATGLEKIQSSSGALGISENKSMRLALSESLPIAGAPKALAGGFTGADKTIAALYSGMGKNHPWISVKMVSERSSRRVRELGSRRARIGYRGEARGRRSQR